jgi:hypothetical protein
MFVSSQRPNSLSVQMMSDGGLPYHIKFMGDFQCQARDIQSL